MTETYKAGTFRMGFLDNISLVGTVAEETGGYIPDVLDMLQESPFLRLVSFFFSTYHIPIFIGRMTSAIPLFCIFNPLNFVFVCI